MSRIILSESAVPSAPAAGKVNVYASNDADPLLMVQDDAGKRASVGGLRLNQNTADVTANAANTYLTGSSINLGTSGLRAGTRIRWTMYMTKSAAGTAAPIFTVVWGTNGTTADTARLTYTLLAQTANADTGRCDIDVIVRTHSTTGVIQGALSFSHNGTTTGLANAAQEQIQQSASAAFDTTVANSIVGICCNPGASGVWTFQQVMAEAYNL